MTELVTITLENEMDLTLAYKRSILTAGMLGLTNATQTAFATAVSEVCREVIDKALNGRATIGVVIDSGRFFMIAEIVCEASELFDRRNSGFEYARKLVPVLEISGSDKHLTIHLKLGIPRSTRIDQRKIVTVKEQIQEDGPVSAYEEVKQKNAALADLNQQHELALEHAYHLDQQKREFLSIASHELNTPLTVIRSYAQIALNFTQEKDTKLKEVLSKLELQSGKMVRLVRQLMDISKFENGDISYNFKDIGADSMMRNVVDDMKMVIKSHAIILENNAPESILRADQLRMEQVLSNLINNAAKYSSPGSGITISTTITDGFYHIEVRDEGIGMSLETQKNVFEKFYRANQVKRKYSGLGMGLYIASRIIDDHQGLISVKSDEGIGSIFTVKIPLKNANVTDNYE